MNRSESFDSFPPREETAESMRAFPTTVATTAAVTSPPNNEYHPGQLMGQTTPPPPRSPPANSNNSNSNAAGNSGSGTTTAPAPHLMGRIVVDVDDIPPPLSQNPRHSGAAGSTSSSSGLHRINSSTLAGVGGGNGNVVVGGHQQQQQQRHHFPPQAMGSALPFGEDNLLIVSAAGGGGGATTTAATVFPPVTSSSHVSYDAFSAPIPSAANTNNFIRPSTPTLSEAAHISTAVFRLGDGSDGVPTGGAASTPSSSSGQSHQLSNQIAAAAAHLTNAAHQGKTSYNGRQGGTYPQSSAATGVYKGVAEDFGEDDVSSNDDLRRPLARPHATATSSTAVGSGEYANRGGHQYHPPPVAVHQQQQQQQTRFQTSIQSPNQQTTTANHYHQQQQQQHPHQQHQHAGAGRHHNHHTSNQPPAATGAPALLFNNGAPSLMHPFGNSRPSCGGRCLCAKDFTSSAVVFVLIVTFTALFIYSWFDYASKIHAADDRMSTASPSAPTTPSADGYERCNGSFRASLVPPVGQIILALLAVGAMFATVATNPGVLLKQVGKNARSHKPPPGHVDYVEVAGVQVLMPYCPTCNIVRPPRSGHCNKCDNCVDTFDHHCGLIGACVGRRNFRYFLIFLYAMIGMALWALVWSIFLAWVVYPTDDTVNKVFMIVIAIASSLTLCLLSYMGAHYAKLVSRGFTQREHLKRQALYPAGKNPYDDGCWRNWAEVCGLNC